MPYSLRASASASRRAACGLLVTLAGLTGSCQGSKNAFLFRAPVYAAQQAPAPVFEPAPDVAVVPASAATTPTPASAPLRTTIRRAKSTQMGTQINTRRVSGLPTRSLALRHKQATVSTASAPRKPKEAGLGLTVVGLLGIPVAVIGLIGLVFGGGLIFALMAIGGAMALFLAYLIPILRRWWG